MDLKRKIWFAALVSGLLVVGCSGTRGDTQPRQEAPEPGATSVPEISPIATEPGLVLKGDTMDHGTENPAVEPGLEGLVAQATQDLADRLRISTNQISVVEARLVVWPDASLGCPQPGMAYIQVPQEGALIVLRADGDLYRYHIGGNRGLFLCETPADFPKATSPNLDEFLPPSGEPEN